MASWVSVAAFYLLAAVVLAAAAGVVFRRNLVHSALLLAVTFIGVAGLYILLAADFLAAVQLLVYNGAVAVIVVIGVMLTQKGDMKNSNPPNRMGRGILAVVVLLAAGMLAAVLTTKWPVVAHPAPGETAAAIAGLLLGEFAIAFEAAAVLLLAAMIGAIILARGGENRGSHRT